MAGSRITAVKSTMQLFLRSLPEGVLFNIVGFGSSHVSLFPSSVPYTEENLQLASQHVDKLKYVLLFLFSFFICFFFFFFFLIYF